MGANRTSEISLGKGSDPRPWKEADQSCSAAGVAGILAESKTLAESALDDPSLADPSSEVFTEDVEACFARPAVAAGFELVDVEGPARSHAEAKVRIDAWTGKLERPAVASWRDATLRALAKDCPNISLAFCA